MADLAKEWRVVEDVSVRVDLWIGSPQEGTQGHVDMMQALGEYVDNVGLCVTATRTWFRYTGGVEGGLRIGIRNYPRYPESESSLLTHAENLGLKMAEAGNQGSFMVEEAGGSVFWFTRRKQDHGEDHEWISGFTVDENGEIENVDVG